MNLLLACQEDTSTQQVQDWLYQELKNLNIKRDRNKMKTGNAGGMRTYYSQLELLGLIVKDPGSKIYVPTRAGQKMMNHEDPLKVFRYQLFGVDLYWIDTNGTDITWEVDASSANQKLLWHFPVSKVSQILAYSHP